MEHSEIVLERIKETWPSDLPLPQVLFGVPVQPVEWAWTLDDEQYVRARAALTELRRPILEKIESELG
jgi:hypothetical protein